MQNIYSITFTRWLNIFDILKKMFFAIGYTAPHHTARPSSVLPVLPMQSQTIAVCCGRFSIIIFPLIHIHHFHSLPLCCWLNLINTWMTMNTTKTSFWCLDWITVIKNFPSNDQRKVNEQQTFFSFCFVDMMWDMWYMDANINVNI